MRLELQLLLACARVLPSQEDEAAIRKVLIDGIDWTSFARTAMEHGLAVLAGHTLNCITPDMVPDEVRDAFRENVDQTRQKNRALFDDLSRVIEALADNGIEAIPFKGPVLAFQAYGDLGLGVFGDPRVLIRDPDLAQAVAILGGLGYERKKRLTAVQHHLIHRLQGHETLLKKGSRVGLQLHTRLTPMNMALDIDYAGLWRRARRATLSGQTMTTLSAEDELLVLAIDGGKELWQRIEGACGVAAFIGAHPKLDWGAVVDRARPQGCLHMVRLAAALARRCFGAAVPDAVTAADRSDPKIERMVQRVMARWLVEEPAASHCNRLSLDRLRLHDGAVRRVRYVVRTLALPGPLHVARNPFPRLLTSLLGHIPFKIAHDIAFFPLVRTYRYSLSQAERLRDAFASRKASALSLDAHDPNLDAQSCATRGHASYDPLATPDFFPARIDVSRNIIVFAMMSRDTFRQSTFLDPRWMVRAGPTTLLAEIPKLLTRQAVLPLQFILHVGYCGSTLLARYLESLPHCLVLKEPEVIGELLSLRHGIPAPADRQWAEWFKVTMALLSRGYPEDRAVVIKAGDINSMGHLFLDHNERTKIVFLFTPLRTFLLQVLKVDDRRQWLRAHMQLLRWSMARVPFLSEIAAVDLRDGQCAAAMWLSNAFICRSLLERPDSHRILVLNGERLISQPGESVFAAADHLGLLADPSNRYAVEKLRPLSHHSKDQQLAYDANTRAAELADAEARCGTEVETAMSWANAVSSGWLAMSPFPLE